MEFLNSWLQGIIISVIIATIIEMILPNGNTKKYVKIILGIYVVFNIITPIINQFTDKNFEISSIINIEEYNKKIESYEVDSDNIDKLNEKNIKEIYINNLKKDIITKLEEKDYLVQKVEIEIKNDETYEIESMKIILLKKETNNEEKEESNTTINEIKKVEIEIGKENQLSDKELKNNLTENEKKEIKKYIISVYEIQENQIIIN